MEVPSVHGRGGTSIPESGMAARTFHSGLDLVSAISEASDGAGGIGDTTGAAVTLFMGAAGTTLEATRFTTEVLSIEAAVRVEDSAARVALSRLGPTEDSGERMETLPDAPHPELQPGHSMEIPRLLEDTPRPVVRAAFAQALLAGTPRAGRQEASRHAGAPASVVGAGAVVEEERVVAEDLTVVGGVNRLFAVRGASTPWGIMSQVNRET